VNARGQRAEAQAARYLSDNGLRIVTRNWRCRFGELDLVARDGTMLVFVEVRMRSSLSHGGAAESISISKRKRLTAAAQLYLSSIGCNAPCRFDAILIDGDEDVHWVRNAFDAT
jgi:putative endonuclease